MKMNTVGPSVTAAADPRVTAVGRVLRAWKLDELPQFWNVLKGDMSLVGPRPELRGYVELYRDRYSQILSVRPGITDPASIAFRNEEQLLARDPDPERLYRETVLPQKLALAERYVAAPSLLIDIRILLTTAWAVTRK
jgi:lipopolysaccharide/colanic/teichoic acid biosynthesis glycosyltransferase